MGEEGKDEPATGGAEVVVAAGVNAAVVRLRADEVRDRLRVLGRVGLLAIAADAAECKRMPVAGVGLGVALGPWELKTDEWALSLLALAPVLSVGLGNGARVNGLLVGAASKGQKDGKGELGMHVG
jgi:hypothetical protein